MRRSDREVTDPSEILAIMERCDVCRLGLVDDDGLPYVVPLNFGLLTGSEQVELVFHGATQGHKVDLMQRDPRASFEMDCGHELQYFEDRGYCTYAYESVMGRGRIELVPEGEKAACLQALMDHYHPGEVHASFNPAAIPRTLVFKLVVEQLTAKRKELKRR